MVRYLSEDEGRILERAPLYVRALSDEFPC